MRAMHGEPVTAAATPPARPRELRRLRQTLSGYLWLELSPLDQGPGHHYCRRQAQASSVGFDTRLLTSEKLINIQVRGGQPCSHLP